MPTLDHYVVLGVPRSATAAEVKGAYRRLAHRFHPDKNGNNPEATRRFQAIQTAYQTLNDPVARAAYDQWVAVAPMATATAERPTAGADRAAGTEAPRPPHAAPAQPPPTSQGPAGDPVQAVASVTLAEVLTGTERTLRIKRKNTCLTCHGAGATSKSAWTRCRRCDGTGHVNDTEGVFSYRRMCPRCHGTGQVVTRPCRSCRGASVVLKPVGIRVKIPPGLESGAVIRFAGQGHAGAFHGPRGDLLLTVTVEPAADLSRAGADLHMQIQLTPWQAALGAVVPVRLPDECVNVRVRSGTQPDTVVRLPGRGLPRGPKNPVRGDCYVRFRVAVPARLTGPQRALYERLARLDGQEPPARASLRQRLLRRVRRGS